MKIKDESLSSLTLKGIYSITNSNGKRYIGSTKKSFLSRFQTHHAKLRCKQHQNKHLQLAWGKYGVNEFTFEVIEVIEKNEIVEIREKFWIEFYNSGNREKGYNINIDPCKAPSLNNEVRSKIKETLIRKYVSGELSLNSGNFVKGIEVWNKGKKYKNTDHLKVPKTITDKVIMKRIKHSEMIRERLPKVEVYKEGNLLGIWNSAKDLEEFSLLEENKLPIKSRFKGEMRRGKPSKFLATNHINLSCKEEIPYKGLYFKFVNQAPLQRNL